MDKLYRVEYNDNAVVSVIDHDNSITYTSNKIIVDTLSNSRTALANMGLNVEMIDYFEQNLAGE